MRAAAPPWTAPRWRSFSPPGHLLGAGLDVTDPEPLPPDHPLWDAPNVLITPHTAGGYNHMQLTLDRIRALFLDNLKRYVAGEPLRNRMR